VSRTWLRPLVPLYAAAVGAKNRGYDRGRNRVDHLRWPVISVGNLSVGGAGKTPLVIRLAELLAEQGLAVDVLSRGYGRASHAIEAVNASGSARQFGDEPLLIARRTGVPVFLGASRYAAGQLAEQRLPPGAHAVHLLDDGFQHRGLARDVDIVVVHRSDLGAGLLPAGRLREPVTALQRATIVVLREEDAVLEEQLRRIGVVAPMWRMRRALDIPAGTGSAVAFCGIARPEEFIRSLGQAGMTLAVSPAFSDHHRYSQKDIDALVRAARAADARCFVTTEKDAVKLDGLLRKQLEDVAPLHVLRLNVLLDNEAAVASSLMDWIGGGAAIR
jgi:tetraacyldisaccharide 4'-kinase